MFRSIVSTIWLSMMGAGNFHKRFVGEDDCSFWDSSDCSTETEIGEEVEKVVG